MKTIIITVCILAAVLFMLYIAVGEAFYHLAIDAHSDKWFLRPKKSKRKTAEDAVDPDSNGYDSVSENPAEAEARDLDTAYFETHIPEIRETVSVIRGKSTGTVASTTLKDLQQFLQFYRKESQHQAQQSKSDLKSL
ncbi:MAG: hypothetical protein IJ449_04715 [Clostridia bacterium]|nr:hypothetical protein [Clostridia bacterium]